MPSVRDILQGALNVLKQVTVEPFLFFSLLGYTIRLVSFQSLLMDSACRNTLLYSDDICDNLDKYKSHKENSIEAGNNLYSGVMLVGSLPAIIVAIFVGPWSDKYTRKIPLMIAAFGMMVEAAISAGLSFYIKVPPTWYIIAAIFTGCSGGFILCLSAAFSYMADITDERSRSARYAFLEFSNICAVILGNISGGQIFEIGGYSPVMSIAPCAFGCAVLYTVFFVKETRPKIKGITYSDMMRDLVTISNIKDSYKTCSMKRPGNIRLQIWLLVWVSCMQKFVDMGTLAVAFPFARGMYDWNVTQFSNASTAFYVVNAIVTVAAVPLLSNKLRLHEAALGLIGMLSLMSKMVINSVAIYQPLFYVAWMSGALNNAAGIAIRSRLSKLVNKDELGRAFSLLGTFESVTPLLGTLAFVQMYNASLNFFPGLAFAISAVLLIPCVIIFSWMMTLPTVSVGDYDRDDVKVMQPMETFSSNYTTLQEEEEKELSFKDHKELQLTKY